MMGAVVHLRPQPQPECILCGRSQGFLFPIANKKLCEPCVDVVADAHAQRKAGVEQARFRDRNIARPVKGKIVHLGTFDTAEEAGAAYQAARRRHHGEFLFGVPFA